MQAVTKNLRNFSRLTIRGNKIAATQIDFHKNNTGIYFSPHKKNWDGVERVINIDEPVENIYVPTGTGRDQHFMEEEHDFYIGQWEPENWDKISPLNT